MDPEEERYTLPYPADWNGRWSRSRNDKCKLKGPLRVLRLCLLAILLPGLLIAVPLYLRYRVYSEQLVPLGMSDMRLIDSKISTTWCQRQLVSSNATFNAYLLPQKPDIQNQPKYVNITKEMVLEDDTKEFWGFYLLKGSTVTVSSCCRRPGASLVVIKGHHHLRQCAYIGDNSSEEAEELEELEELKKILENEKDHYSIPKLMQRARPDVKFHGNNDGKADEKYLLSKELDLKEHADDFDLPLLEEHRAKTRPTGVEKKQIEESTVNTPASEELIKALINKMKRYKSLGKNFLEDMEKKSTDSEAKRDWSLLKKTLEKSVFKDQKANHETENGVNKNGTEMGRVMARRHIKIMHSLKNELNMHDEDANNAEEQGFEHQEVRGSINGTTANDTSNSEFWSSFSSSEERLLECEGLILSQPLIPSPLCHRSSSDHQLEDVFNHQRISYTVPGNGYYFFVFGSENEIQDNYIRTHFQLEKKMYNVSNPVVACENSTDKCSLPLNFFSQERLVLELPVNDSLWNNEFLVKSTCEPRTAVYVACIIAVPIVILLCAF